MGVAASAAVWYGVLNEDLSALDGNDDFFDSELTVDGINIHPVWAYDTLLGVGGTVSHAWWGDDEEVDLTKVEPTKAAVDKFLDEHGIEGERKLRLLANYS